MKMSIVSALSIVFLTCNVGAFAGSKCSQSSQKNCYIELAASEICIQRAKNFERDVASFNSKCTGVGSVSQAELYNQCAKWKARLAAEQNSMCSQCGC